MSVCAWGGSGGLIDGRGEVRGGVEGLPGGRVKQCENWNRPEYASLGLAEAPELTESGRHGSTVFGLDQAFGSDWA